MTQAIPILTKRDSEKMKQAGNIACELKSLLRQKAQPDVTTQQLDDWAEQFIRQKDAEPAFKGYQGFPTTIITSINEEVVHSIPSKRQLKKGDFLTIDLGVIWQGFYSDTATTFVVGEYNPEPPFLSAGKQALKEALKQCVPGKHVGDISFAIQKTIEAAGFNVVRKFTGHGIGRNLHQPPEIPCFGEQSTREELKEGMGLAVEVMYTKGDYELKILEDGWTAVTADGKLAAHFEETVIVKKHKPLVLTNNSR